MKISVLSPAWVLIATAVSYVQGAPVADTTSETGLTPTVQSSATPPIDDSKRYFLSRYWGHVKGLNYGQEFGVFGKFKNYWSDEEYMYFPGHHRTISEIACTRKTGPGRLIGLQGRLKVAGKPGKAFKSAASEYHGWRPTQFWKAVTKRMKLDVLNGESISKVSYKTCGKYFEGIKIETDHGQSIECGNWHALDKQNPDKTCINGHDGTLSPGEGRKVIGLFGDAKGYGVEDEVGIRGLGLITIPSSTVD